MGNFRDIRVRVTPGAKREYVKKEGDLLVIAVAAPAEGGRANERVRELAADFLARPVRQVLLVKGKSSPAKLLRVWN